MTAQDFAMLAAGLRTDLSAFQMKVFERCTQASRRLHGHGTEMRCIMP